MPAETDRRLVNIDQAGHSYLSDRLVRARALRYFCTTGPLSGGGAGGRLGSCARVLRNVVVCYGDSLHRLPDQALIACGFEHSVANMYLLPIGVVFTWGSRHHSQSDAVITGVLTS